jgi:hypothetical protein
LAIDPTLAPYFRLIGDSECHGTLIQCFCGAPVCVVKQRNTGRLNSVCFGFEENAVAGDGGMVTSAKNGGHQHAECDDHGPKKRPGNDGKATHTTDRHIFRFFVFCFPR